MSTTSFGPQRRTTDAPSLDPVDRGTVEEFAQWHADFRSQVLAELDVFLRRHRIEALRPMDVADILRQYVGGGKCLRSTFMYLGWLCGRGPSRAALRASAGLEVVHAFALLQDDVMDEAAIRRGGAAAHVRLAQWHRHRGLPGSEKRFGESAATLLGDVCLVWAEQMLRESGVDDAALAGVWPRYDAMRVELAVGQFADLVNDARGFPTLDAVLAIARAKSGNYTVRRPLEMGAAMAGCGEDVMGTLADYGSLIGEAFQLRDDMLGVFGSAAITGKPGDSDLGQRKATSVVVAAHHLADSSTRRSLADLMNRETLDELAIARWRELIDATGAREFIEDMITDRVRQAGRVLSTGRLDAAARAALEHMAMSCTKRET